MIPKDCRYTKEHEWVRLDGDGHVKIGITDFAQDQLGDIVFIELPEPGAKLTQHQPFGTLEAVKTVSDLYSPVDGEVAEANQAVQEDPGVINKAPYEDGWLLRAKIEDTAQLDNLLTPEQYEEQIKEMEG
ncbi:MAG: glycine cleavage system protein GcvH [Candidatus Eisenbacteria bacterium]|nr:glycine cleavage system protein GcvH [Candidatus Latescibacterota bacterium]MBD3301658.1 glycine cleavage system protein GcvH [Candidatus Eisenbacteria bacterium]